MTLFRQLVLGLALGLVAAPAMAQDAAPAPDGRTLVYFGAGKARADDHESDATPFVIGLMHRGASRGIVGFDIAREGTMLDSTWNQDEEVSPGTSFNLLLGGNLLESGRFSTDAALLLGLRHSASDCPDSYLGYQCYADQDPENEYRGNFGAVLSVSYDRAMIGLRATGESTQILTGFRF